MMDDDRRLDGNMLGGLLAELFQADLTVATGTCAHCGAAGPVATLLVYATAMGTVARCAACEQVLIRVVRGPGRAWLDLRGLRSLQIDLTT
jgi:uncharacterized protein DUF6510